MTDGIIQLYSPEEAQRVTRINPTDLSTDMVEVAGHYARWAQIAVEARRQRDACKSRKSLMEARVDLKVRHEAASTGEKMTEARINSMVRAHPKVVEAEGHLNEAEAMLFGAL